MENNNANLPAFPPNAGWEHSEATGLSKREYFAAMAMQAVLSDVHVQFWMKTDPRYNGDNFDKVVAINSIEFADAILKQLEETKQL